jgi:uncharacterized membrane protein YkoI
MNTAKLRSKRVLIPTTVAVAVLAVGGVVWASTANAELQGSERDRVAAAATSAAGGGEAVSVEASDDRGEAYEVEVRKDDGTEVDVALDENLGVVARDADADDDRTDDRTDDRSDDVNERPDADDRVLSPAETTAAEKAALAAVPGATDAHAEASDDPGAAYEVDVRTSDNTEWNVELDANFEVLHKAVDR